MVGYPCTAATPSAERQTLGRDRAIGFECPDQAPLVVFQHQCGQVAGTKGAGVDTDAVVGVFDVFKDRVAVNHDMAKRLAVT